MVPVPKKSGTAGVRKHKTRPSGWNSRDKDVVAQLDALDSETRSSLAAAPRTQLRARKRPVNRSEQALRSLHALAQSGTQQKKPRAASSDERLLRMVSGVKDIELEAKKGSEQRQDSDIEV